MLLRKPLALTHVTEKVFSYTSWYMEKPLASIIWLKNHLAPIYITEKNLSLSLSLSLSHTHTHTHTAMHIKDPSWTERVNNNSRFPFVFISRKPHSRLGPWGYIQRHQHNKLYFILFICTYIFSKKKIICRYINILTLDKFDKISQHSTIVYNSTI